MASCLRCVKFGIGGRLTSNPGSRIIVGVSESSGVRVTQCIRNATATNPNVVQASVETELISSFHPSSFGNIIEQQQQLLDKAACTGPSLLLSEGSETSPRYCEKQASVETELISSFHPSSFGNIIEQQQQLLDKAACTGPSLLLSEGSETSPRYCEKQREAQRRNKLNTLECTHAARGNLHCFDPLGLILCPSVHSPEDIQIFGSEVALSEDSKTNVRTFRLPPDALWYPRGTHHQGSDLVCSVLYSEIESEVLFENITDPIGDNVETSVLHSKDTAYVQRSLTSDRALDVRDFMKDVCRENDGDFRCSLLNASSPKSNKVDPTGKPSLEQLTRIYNVLSENLPKMFVEQLDYKIYSHNIVFENRIRGKVSVGLGKYIRQISLLRTIGHLKYVFVNFEILKITKHPEDGTIRVRWQIRGMSGLKALYRFVRVNLFNKKEVQAQFISWYDGYSTFYVGGDGVIHKHVADSMMPDEEQSIIEKGALTAKLAALLGLVHRPTLGDASTPLPFDLGSLSIMLKEDEEMYSQLMFPLERIQ